MLSNFLIALEPYGLAPPHLLKQETIVRFLLVDNLFTIWRTQFSLSLCSVIRICIWRFAYFVTKFKSSWHQGHNQVFGQQRLFTECVELTLRDPCLFIHSFVHYKWLHPNDTLGCQSEVIFWLITGRTSARKKTNTWMLMDSVVIWWVMISSQAMTNCWKRVAWQMLHKWTQSVTIRIFITECTQ